MAKQEPIFNDVMFWLNKVCILPYTDEELDGLGCLGFDIKKYPEFGKKYMEKLLEKCSSDANHQRMAFSNLNLQLYRRVLEQSDLQQIPDWIVMPQQTIQNPLKARIVKMYSNLTTKQNNLVAVSSKNMDGDITK
ncbi:MAG: hypothetical protein IJ660_03535 [Alphaproteobacteria bacterium]|nr:hypothetical protein [Alphaproteobacteria bacterium]